MGKRELVALLCLSSLCVVALPHSAVSWSAVCDCGISDHTHLLFSYSSILLRFSKRVRYGLSCNSCDEEYKLCDYQPAQSVQSLLAMW